MAPPKREQVDRLLQSVEYPADREAILATARQRRTAQALRSIVELLPNRQYATPASARRELERIDPTLKRASARPQKPRVATEQPTEEPQSPQGLQLPEPVREAAASVRATGEKLIGEAGGQVQERADQQRTEAAETIQASARTLRDAGTQLEQQGQRQAGQVIGFAAQQLESASSYLRQTDVRQMLQQAQQIARRQPWLVLALGVGVGFATTRLLKSADLQQLTGQSSQTASTGAAVGIQASAGSDAIGLLEADHRELRQLLRRGESAAIARRTSTLEEIKTLLQTHERMEEEVFYPALKENPATRELVMESFAEHQVVDDILSDIEVTDVADEMWKSRFVAMKENLEHHVQEEETELFPLTQKAFTRGELRELGKRMEEIKQLATERAAI